MASVSAFVALSSYPVLDEKTLNGMYTFSQDKANSTKIIKAAIIVDNYWRCECGEREFTYGKATSGYLFSACVPCGQRFY